MTRVEFTLVGEIGATVTDGAVRSVHLTPGARVALVLLARRVGDWVTADRLRRFLTTERTGQVATSKNLSVRVAELRRALGPHGVALEHQSGRYRLRPTPDVNITTDIHRAQQLIERAHTASDDDIGPIVDALALITRTPVQADFAAFVEFDELARELDHERRRIDDVRHELQLRAGSARDLVSELATAVRNDPEDDELVIKLARATHRLHGPHAALELIGQRQRALTGRGLAPSRDLDVLRRQVHARDPLLGLPAVPSIDDEPCPTALRRAARHAAVPRQAMITTIGGAFDAVRSDTTSRLVRVAGPAGHGKTVLLGAASAVLHDEGDALVSFGTCLADGSPLVPFRHLLELADRHLPAAMLGRLVADVPLLAAFLPTRGEGGPHSTAHSARTPAEQRLQTLEAMRRMVVAIAEVRPLVLVLDDIQWADEITRSVITGLASAPVDEPLLVLLGERVEPGGRPSRIKGVVDVVVQAFDASEAHELLAAAGVDAHAQAAGRLLHLTAGIPILADEVVRQMPHVLAPGVAGHPQVSEDANEMLTRRLEALTRPARELLDACGVLGAQFDWRHAADVAEVDHRAAIALVDDATRAGVLTQHDDERGSVYRFDHALMHSATLHGVSRGRQVFLHGRAVAVLERWSADPRIVAEHALQAIDDVGRDKTAAILADAAAAAVADQAFADALRLADLASGMREALTDEQTCDLRVVEGSAAAAIGDPTRARQAFEEALGLARAAGDAERVASCIRARAALGHRYVRDDRAITDLYRTIESTPVEEVATRGELAVLLAYEYLFAAQPTEAIRTLDTVERELGQSGGDAALTGQVLAARLNALAHCGYPLAERMATLERMETVAQRDRDTAIVALAHRAVLCLHTDVPDEADRLLNEMRSAADEAGRPYPSWLARAASFSPAFVTGDLAEAERRSTAALEYGQSRGVAGAFGGFATQQYAMAWARGDASGYITPLEQLASTNNAELAWRAGLALAYVHGGRMDDARRVLDELATARPEEFDSLMGNPAIVLITEAAVAASHDASLANVLAHLERRDGQHIILGLGMVDYGPARRYLRLARGASGAARTVTA